MLLKKKKKICGETDIHKIKHFDVNNSVASSHHVRLVPERVRGSYMKLHSHQAITPPLRPQHPAPSTLCSVSLDLPLLDILYKWEGPLCDSLWPASFTQHNVFEVHVVTRVRASFLFMPK